MTTEVITMMTAGVGIVGSLGGVIIGQRMSRSWQREQWLLDRRVEEFRELLDALADSLRVCMSMYVGAVLDEQAQRDIVATQSNTMRVIRSRIFVIGEVIKFDIETLWSKAVIAHHKTKDDGALGVAFNRLRVQIVTASMETLGASRKPWYRRILRRKMKVSKQEST